MSYLGDIAENIGLGFPGFLSLFVLSALLWIAKHYRLPRIAYISGGIGGISLVSIIVGIYIKSFHDILIINGKTPKWIISITYDYYYIIIIVSFIMAVISFSYYINKYYKNKRLLKQNFQYMSMKNFKKAWDSLDGIKKSELTGKQLRTYTYRRLNIRHILGCLAGFDGAIGSVKEKSLEYYFALFIRDSSQMNYEAALYDIQQANSLLSSSDNAELKMKVLQNLGFCYAKRGDYKNAKTIFQEAISVGSRSDVMDDSLWIDLFYNFIRCSLKDDPQMKLEKVYSLIDDLWSLIDPDAIENYIQVFNIKLSVMRELKVNREEKDNLVDQCLYYILNHETDEQKLICFLSSCLDIIVKGRFNLDNIFRLIAERQEVINNSDPDIRYNTYKILYNAFENLYSQEEEDKKLKESTIHYMYNEARKDIQRILEKTPSEFVYQKGRLFQELASLLKFSPNDYKEAIKYFKSAKVLYQDNGLIFEELNCDTWCLDELCAPAYCDESGIPLHKNEVEEFWISAEKICRGNLDLEICLAPLIQLAILSTIYGDFNHFLLFFSKYSASIRNISLEHYAPHIRQNAALSFLYSRIFGFIESIKKIQNSPLLENEDKIVIDWFKGISKTNGFEISFVFGLCLGFKKQIILVSIGYPYFTRSDTHWWFVLSEFCYYIDLLYPYDGRLSTNKNYVYPLGSHPLEKDVHKIVSADSSVSKFYWIDVCEILKENPYITRIEELIEANLPNWVASIQDIISIMHENIEPPVVAPYDPEYKQ